MSRCDEYYEPPPMPAKDEIPPAPAELYVKEATWPLWQGSPSGIGRLAVRARDEIAKEHRSFQQRPPRSSNPEIQQGIERMPQNFVFYSCSVTTPFTSGTTSVEQLPEEIGARRSSVTVVEIESSVIRRGWPIAIWDALPLRQIPPPRAEPGIHFSTETGVPPQRIELEFRNIPGEPAARLRVIAAGPIVCARLWRAVAPYVEAGARPKAWDLETGAALGVGVGAVPPAVIALAGWLPPGWMGLAVFTLGAAGGAIGRRLTRWAMPPLELIEPWESSRWQRLKSWFWQGFIFALGVAGIVITIILSQPSSSH